MSPPDFNFYRGLKSTSLQAYCVLAGQRRMKNLGREE
jgi:hypothetical protein